MARLRNATALSILFDEKASQFTDRNGGYTRISKFSDRRIGEATAVVVSECV